VGIVRTPRWGNCGVGFGRTGMPAETGTDWGDARSARIPKSASAVGACPPASVAGACLPASVIHARDERGLTTRVSNPSVLADTPAYVLRELRVENLLLIERAELELAPGLNVLTGETGAGKTVLAQALDLLLGGRARAGIVRPGAGEAYVEGAFAPSPALLARRSRGTLASGEHPRFGQREGELWELLAPDAEELVLARRVGADGRTRAYMNGRTVAVGDLRKVGEALLSFYGQHEHRKLTLAAAQLEILDGFCGPEQAARRVACAAAHREVHELNERLEGLRELDGARERELDLLEHELAEIDALGPREGELERLRAERERLRQLDALLAAAVGAAEALAGGQGYDGGSDAPAAMMLAARAAARLESLVGVDPVLDALAERAGALAIEAGDLAGELRDYGERLESEATGAEESVDYTAGAPWAGEHQDGLDGGAHASRMVDGRHAASGPQAGEHAARGLQAVEERLAALERLLRKHGPTVAAVLEHGERARSRCELLRGAAVALEEVSGRLRAARAALETCVGELRAAREEAAPRLSEAVREQLAALAMPDAAFAVELSPREAGPTGGDAVELTIAPNPGVPAAPVREIASGGELSRVMLALMTVANSDSRATLVFDEVDAGIGGHTARAVGERLRELARARQVLCITHLPQIASLAVRHFTVVKDAVAGSTSARVERLGEPEVLSELVRMLGAPERDASARRHARELRKAA
jgi:DNA repair protein RecN (Recombination protein N)